MDPYLMMPSMKLRNRRNNDNLNVRPYKGEQGRRQADKEGSGEENYFKSLS